MVPSFLPVRSAKLVSADSVVGHRPEQDWSENEFLPMKPKHL